MLPYLWSIIAAPYRWIAGGSSSQDEAIRAQVRSSRTCRYRLDNDSSATIVLSDGRKLGYAQYGSLGGRPIFHLHGLPGSRLEGAFWDDLAKKLNARLIAVDRPGYGWSTPQPGRKPLNHAEDVRNLAKHLKLKEYSVMGISGGGPYALACAAALPADELKGVAVVVGLGPPDIGNTGMNIAHYIGYTWVYRKFTWLAAWWLAREPGGRLDLDDEERLELALQTLANSRLHPRDAEVMSDRELTTDTYRVSIRSQREAHRQGVEWIADDGRIIASDWGFRVQEVRQDLPVGLWYGKFDNFVPANHGVQIAARLGEKAHLHIENETHSSLTFSRMEEVLTELLKSM